MLRTASAKIAWVGKATVFLVGLSVILALVFGVATSALGANGKPFLLGKRNVASAISTLVKKGPGPALNLKVGAGQPPLVVNSTAGTATNLSADKLDGQDSAGFLSSERTYVVTRAQNPGPNTITIGGASCDDEDLAISGGFNDVNSTTHVEASGPNPGFSDGWSVRTITASTAGDSYNAYALCADSPPLRP